MDRTVFVTGAGSGIGLASALAAARRGYQVVGSDRADELVEPLAKAAGDEGLDVEVLALDVTDADACEDVLAGRDVYGLVSCAGYAEMGAIEDVADGDIRAQLEVLALAPMRLARLVLPGMRLRGEGRIITISSILGFIVAPTMGWYAAGKHALEAANDALRMEVAGTGVRVVSIQPGLIDTPIYDRARGRLLEREEGPTAYGATYEAWRRLTRVGQPLFTRPEVVAKRVADALDAPRPAAHQLVGYDAQVFGRLYQVTPVFLRDLAFRTALRLAPLTAPR